MKEPILFFVVGGMPLMVALVHVVRAFGVPITEPEEAALYVLWSTILGILARMGTVSVASLPPGTVEKIEAAKTAAKVTP